MIGPVEQLRELGQVNGAPRTNPDIHFLPIIGQIEGHVVLPAKNKTTKYEHVLPQLAAIEQDPHIRGVVVLLNTVGGDIEAGLAIAEMIRGLSKPTVSLVLGGGHSIGAPIAVAADRSFIAHTATMTIHPIRFTGMLIGVPQTYDYLEKMQERIIRFILENSRITESALRDVMFRTGELVRDVGTVLIGKDAVDIGLIDAVGSIGDAIRWIRQAIDGGAKRHKGYDAPAGSAGAAVYGQLQVQPQGFAPAKPSLDRPAPFPLHRAPFVPPPAPPVPGFQPAGAPLGQFGSHSQDGTGLSPFHLEC